MMRIGILQTGHAPDELQPDHGDYDLFFRRLLGENRFEYQTFAVVDDVFPSGPDVVDGWLITGSKFSVNDQDEWIGKLEDFVREIHASGMPLVGICFGHQMIAKALGGVVDRSPDGWTAGPTEYARDDLGRSQTMLAWHQDQVLQKPEGAKVLATSQFCPFAILRYGDTVLSYQAHPEFSADFVKGLVTYRGGSLPDMVRDNVANASDDVVNRQQYADEITAFFNSRAKKIA